MANILRTRIKQGYRTMRYPDGRPPDLPGRFAGRPVIAGACDPKCKACTGVCPTQALVTESGGLRLDMGRCLFCRACEQVCTPGVVRFSSNHQLAAGARHDLVVTEQSPERARALHDVARVFYSRSLKLRQVSAGGCNACEADSNVLGTPAWDMGRFGIQFVASPRHADGLLITGPVTHNMREALLKTYQAVPEPRIVIAVGACAISGGPYAGHSVCCNGADTVVPVDLYVPGCPPHPLTILDSLLRFLGRVPEST